MFFFSHTLAELYVDRTHDTKVKDGLVKVGSNGEQFTPK